MSVQYVDSNGGVLWTSPALPPRGKSEVTRTKSDDAAAVRVDRSDVFLPGDGGCGSPGGGPTEPLGLVPLSSNPAAGETVPQALPQADASTI